MNSKERDPRTHAIIGAAMEVLKSHGTRFFRSHLMKTTIGAQRMLSTVYHECLEIEFNLRKIEYVSKPQLNIFYKENQLQKYYIPDFLVFDEIIVEIKAERCLTRLQMSKVWSQTGTA